MKRILFIDDEAKERIAQILEYADSNRYDPEDKSDGWLDRVPGNDPNLQCILVDGYRCVFSYTHTGVHSFSRGYIYNRHLSISTPRDYPSPTAVMMIAKLFGFTGEPTARSLMPQEWMVQIRKPGHVTDDPCIIIMQEAE